jgi:hypothetical protein
MARRRASAADRAMVGRYLPVAADETTTEAVARLQRGSPAPRPSTPLLVSDAHAPLASHVQPGRPVDAPGMDMVLKSVA